MAHGGAHPGRSGAPGWTLRSLDHRPAVPRVAIYGIGFARLGARRGLWRGREPVRRRLAGARLFPLVSPLHEAGERSFTLHMIEHELIMLVAAFLLPLSRPLGCVLCGPFRAGGAGRLRRAVIG
jgi:putative membrane protein